MNDDVKRLHWLVIGHYVNAAITALFSCLPLIHLSIGLWLLFDPPQPAPGAAQFPDRMFGLLFAVIGGGMALFGWTLAVCNFVAGRSIAARKRRKFCIVVAAINCAFFPQGTALGVLTLLALLQPSVKAMFEPHRAIIPPPASAPRPGAWRDDSIFERNDR
jgi:hypothetical protein